MLAKLITVVAVVSSLVAFIAEVHNTKGSWIYPLDRASYVLVALAVVACLLSERRASVVTLGAQLAVAATAVAFMAVALVKYYGTTSAFGESVGKAYPWANEAQLLAVAALAFGLTVVRRRSTVIVVGLMAGVLAAIGSSIYAITQKASYDGEMWWWIATAAAFLAASAAATLDREGTAGADAPVWDAPVSDEPVSDAPVPSGAGGDSGSDPGVE